MDNFTLSLTILLTGFVVVFLILFLLIGVIKLYGTIVYNAQNKVKNKEKVKEDQNIVEPQTQVETFSNSINDELIAVISAAVDAMYGTGKVKVKTIKRSTKEKSAWRSAGVINNTRPF